VGPGPWRVRAARGWRAGPPGTLPAREGRGVSLPLPDEEAALKKRALLAYPTQVLVIGRYMLAFGRSNELFIEGERLSDPELAAAQAFVAQLQTDGAGRALVQRVRMMVARNEYKRRQAPPILRVRPRAFGSGRQMPIAARYV